MATPYHSPDLTATSPLHYISNDVHAVRSNNKIYFRTPVFADTITMHLIGTMPSLLHKEVYTKDVDWMITEEDIAQSDTSDMTVLDPTFNKTLVHSVTITAVYPGAPYNLNLTYQQLYPNAVRTGVYGSDPLVLTPALVQSILNALSRLELQVSRVNEVTTPESGYTKLLPIDPYMEDPLNYIEKEPHDLDTPNGVAFIKPAYGSFYASSVKVYHPMRNEWLTENTHYRIVGMNVASTKATKATVPVFDFILFTEEIVGEVEIYYHAYGGEAEVVHFHDVWKRLMDIVHYLNEATFVTETTLQQTPVVLLLENRIATLEERMRQLLIGKPSYGDATHGMTRIYKVTAPDSQLHWWTIASLFKVDGSDSIIDADRMKLRMNLMQAKCIMDVYLSFNLNNPEGNRFSVSIGDANLPRGYVPYKDYSGVDSIVTPQFRVIWNEDPSTYSGAMIQIGLPLKNILTETVGIEDMSGMECCWKLRNESDTALQPEDSTIALPAEDNDLAHSFVWSTANPHSKSESTLIPTRMGHLAWAGSHCLNRPGGWNNFTVPHLLDPLVDYRRFTKIRLELSERGAYQFPVDVELVPGLDVMVGTTTASYYREPLDVMVQLRRDSITGAIQLDLNTNVHEDGANPLDLMGVVVFV